MTTSIETADQFRAWLEAAQPGDAVTYHRGHLALAASVGRISALREAVQTAAGLNVANLSDDGFATRKTAGAYFLPDLMRQVDLVQRRLDKGSEYLAIVRVDQEPRSIGRVK